MPRETTCCFSGHRSLPEPDISLLSARLLLHIHMLCEAGVTDFVSGGALGFDQLAAEAVIEARASGLPVRLIMALPCENQDGRWAPAQRQRYRTLLAEADERHCLSPAYYVGCMAVRNRFMVDRAAHMLCYQTSHSGGTAQTIAYAREKGLSIVNLAQSARHEK